MAVGAMPEVRQRIAEIGLLPMDSPAPDELRTFLEIEIATWGAFVQQIGLAGSL